MGDQRLRPVERLRCPRAYQRVFEQGEKLVGSLFILYVLPTSEPYSRLGMAVSKRLGNAVVRNRVRRRLRHLMRERIGWFPEGSLLVIRAHPAAADARQRDLAADLDLVLGTLLRRRVGALSDG